MWTRVNQRMEKCHPCLWKIKSLALASTTPPIRCFHFRKSNHFVFGCPTLSPNKRRLGVRMRVVPTTATTHHRRPGTRSVPLIAHHKEWATTSVDGRSKFIYLIYEDLHDYSLLIGRWGRTDQAAQQKGGRKWGQSRPSLAGVCYKCVRTHNFGPTSPQHRRRQRHVIWPFRLIEFYLYCVDMRERQIHCIQCSY